MTTSRERSSVWSSLSHLAWPVIWGLGLTIGFYLLILRGPLHHAMALRYFAGHPVSYTETAMFFIGLSALIMKLLDVVGQTTSLSRIHLEEPPPQGQRVDDCTSLLDQIESWPERLRQSYFGRRLADALDFVLRRGTAEGLDDELKYLADSDLGRQHESYGLVRIVIWATPMLGFLGTVVGITQALGDLDPQELANSIQTAMDKLLSGLYVAFDTTALALTLSILLMFLQFLIDRLESQLLATVDQRANEELSGRFEQLGTAHDPHLASIERMSQTVVRGTEQLVERQTQLWHATVTAAEKHWATAAQATTEQSQVALAAALDAALGRYSMRMAQLEEEAAERARGRWEQWQTVLSDNARLLHAQQTELVKQGETMVQVLQATGNIMQLEKALNENLKSLAGARNFEDTVMSLSAAIHLLNTRLGAVTEPTRSVQLQPTERQGRAA